MYNIIKPIPISNTQYRPTHISTRAFQFVKLVIGTDSWVIHHTFPWPNNRFRCFGKFARHVKPDWLHISVFFSCFFSSSVVVIIFLCCPFKLIGYSSHFFLTEFQWCSLSFFFSVCNIIILLVELTFVASRAYSIILTFRFEQFLRNPSFTCLILIYRYIITCIIIVKFAQTRYSVFSVPLIYVSGIYFLCRRIASHHQMDGRTLKGANYLARHICSSLFSRFEFY